MGGQNNIGNNASIFLQTEKIDNAPTEGLLGTPDSIGYKLEEIEKHFHNHEHWRGKLAVQTATNWADNGLAPYRAISGLDDYGQDANDEAQVFGTADTPVSVGMVKFDPYRILVSALSSNTPWKLRMAYGDGTLAEAITAEQFSEVMVINIIATGNAGGLPLDFRLPRQPVGTKIWIQAWNATDNAFCDFFSGLHEYLG